DRLEGTANTRNAAAKLIESPRAREILELAFPRPVFERLMRTAEAEARFSRTRQTVLGGSPTARIQEGVRGLESATGFMRGLQRGEILGAFVRSLASGLRQLGIGKVSDDTLRELSRLLFDEYAPPPAQIQPRPSRFPRVEVQPGAVAAGSALASQGERASRGPVRIEGDRPGPANGLPETITPPRRVNSLPSQP